jgi:hypothetical protein
MDAIALDNAICCLCGSAIAANPANLDEALSMDHVPPKQFYPKQLRTDLSPNLWSAPTHKRCNGDFQKDEEYFYHAVYPLVQNGNLAMGKAVYADLMRRTKKPQTPAMLRRLLKTCTTVANGGIYFPPGIVRFSLDAYRVQRVAIKIAQGLLYLDYKRYVPRQNCKDIRLCELETGVPELYQLSWQGAEAKSVVPAVFSYRRFEFENLHLLSLFFWESFMICAAFENPFAASAPAA